MLVSTSSLYIILDREVNDYEALLRVACCAAKKRVDFIQLRDKKGSAKDTLLWAKRIAKLKRANTRFIVNDRIDIALAAQADGVHLGQDDLPVDLARSLMRPGAIIGKSCQTLEQAYQAEQEGASYIGFGSVFKTKTKPERSSMDLAMLKQVISSVRIPVYAIGGITIDRMPAIRDLGAKHVAVCRSICEAKDINAAIEAFQDI